MSMLVVAGQSRTIKLLNKKDSCWKEIHSTVIEDVDQTGCEVSSVAWSPHGSYLALCGKKWEHIYILNCKIPDVTTSKMKIPSGKFQNCCSFDKSGQVLATVGVSGEVFLWKLNQGTGVWDLIKELPNFTLATVTTLCWEPTARYLCTGNTKGHVTVHVRDSLKEYNFSNKIDLFNGHNEEITALVCNPYFPYQPEEASVGFSSGLLVIWDIKTKKAAFSVNSHSTTITDIAYSTINGMLLATASLDGEIHLISVKNGTVIKKLPAHKPIYSVDFVKGKQELVYLTDTELVTYNLRESWPSRKVDGHTRCRYVRYQTSRDPIEEAQSAYLQRCPPSVRKEISQDVKGLKNNHQFDPHKPSPACKGLTREQISSQFATAASAVEGQRSEPARSEPARSEKPHNIPNISDIEEAEEEAGSFNISDIANYTDRGDDENRFTVLHKRSVDGSSRSKVMLSPEGNEVTTECPNKVRRIAEEGKENLPPKAATPKDILSSKQPRFVSSTPAVAASTSLPRFGTPTSSMTRNRAAHGSGTPASSAASLLRRTPTTQPARDASLISDCSPSSLISSLSANLSVADLSHKLKAMGNKDMGTKMSTSGSNLLQVPSPSSFQQGTNLSPMASSQGSGVLAQQVLTPNTNITDNSGVLMSSDQMGLIQTMLTDGFKDLKKELNSEARWLKNEIVKNTLATEWNLEDILKKIVERQTIFEQRLTNMEHDIVTIKNNI